jgi:hypothetical protein
MRLAPTRVGPLVLLAAVVAASIGLTVAGLVAERWCMIPPEDDDEGPASAGGGHRGGSEPSPA